jgi:hypothetical protein
MKFIASGLLALGLLAIQAPEANAVVCARGAYHAGCAGARGAVVTHRGYGYGRHCYRGVGGRMVCR